MSGSATDLAGNLASGTVTINLDQVPPEAFIQFDPTSKDVVLFGRDSLSGVAPGPVTPISVQSLLDNNNDDRDKDDKRRDEDDRRAEIRTYQVFDLAGNSLMLVAEVRKHEESETVRLVSVQYNGGAVVSLPRNEETFEWNFDRDGTLKVLHQNLTESFGNDSQQWDAEYESRRGTTTIERESPKPKQKTIVSGVDLLRAATSKGQLLIEH